MIEELTPDRARNAMSDDYCGPLVTLNDIISAWERDCARLATASAEVRCSSATITPVSSAPVTLRARIVASLPGTVSDLAKRLGHSRDSVYQTVLQLRKEGIVQCVGYEGIAKYYDRTRRTMRSTDD